MGFDFDMRRPPAALPPGYRPERAETPGYFGMSRPGMEFMRKIMGRAGVLDEAVAMAWPAWPPEEGDAERWWALVGALDHEPGGDMTRHELAAISPPVMIPERATVTIYLRKRDAHRAIRSEDPARVPEIKFKSNDFWHVVPDECRAIAAGLRRGLAAEGAGLWGVQTAEPVEQVIAWVEAWATYNEIAAEHDGYRVG